MTLDFLGFQVSMVIVTQLVEIIFCWPCENFKLSSIELQTVFQFPIFINYISLCTMQREELFLFFLLFSLEKYLDPSDGSKVRGVHIVRRKRDITHYVDIYSRQSSFRQLFRTLNKVIYSKYSKQRPCLYCGTHNWLCVQ